MTAERWPKEKPAAAASPDESSVPPHQTIVTIAERELERALLEQSTPARGMYAHPSADQTAFRRAVRTICYEARRRELKAEEMLVGIKEAWSHLADVRVRVLRDRDGDVLREVISSSIEVFFEAREASDDQRHSQG